MDNLLGSSDPNLSVIHYRTPYSTPSTLQTLTALRTPLSVIVLRTPPHTCCKSWLTRRQPAPLLRGAARPRFAPLVPCDDDSRSPAARVRLVRVLGAESKSCRRWCRGRYRASGRPAQRYGVLRLWAVEIAISRLRSRLCPELFLFSVIPNMMRVQL